MNIEDIKLHMRVKLVGDFAGDYKEAMLVVGIYHNRKRFGGAEITLAWDDGSGGECGPWNPADLEPASPNAACEP